MGVDWAVEGGVSALARGPGRMQPATSSMVYWPASGAPIWGILGILCRGNSFMNQFAEILRWAWHVSTYKTVEPIIRQCFSVRHLGILGYKTLSYIPIYSVTNISSFE